MNKKFVAVIAMVICGAIGFYMKPPQSFSSRPATVIKPEAQLPIVALSASPTPAPQAEQNQDLNKSRRQYRMTKLYGNFEINLRQRLFDKEYSPYETELIVKEVIDEFNKFEEVFQISNAAYRAGEILGFDILGQSSLKARVLGVYVRSYELTFDDWNQCLNSHVKNKPSCVQDIAQDLSRSLAEIVDHAFVRAPPDIDRLSIAILEKARDDAVARCRIPYEEASMALDIEYPDCP